MDMLFQMLLQSSGALKSTILEGQSKSIKSTQEKYFSLRLHLHQNLTILEMIKMKFGHICSTALVNH